MLVQIYTRYLFVGVGGGVERRRGGVAVECGKSSCFVVDLDHDIGVYYGLLSEARGLFS